MEKEKDFFQCFVVETSDQTIIGFASFYFTFYSWSGKRIYLDDLYVTEQYRQQKTGNHLLQSVINLGKEQHCKRMRWQASIWNTSAIGFYKGIGATVDDVDINCDLNLSSLIINQDQPA